jgi:hypothetical protein
MDAVVPEGARLHLVVSGGTGWNRLPSVPNYSIDLLEGAGRSSVTVVRPRPAAADFFTPPKR